MAGKGKRIEFDKEKGKWVVYDGDLIYTTSDTEEGAEAELEELKKEVGTSFDLFDPEGTFLRNYNNLDMGNMILSGEVKPACTIKVVAVD